MSITTLDGKRFARMIQSGAQNLQNNVEFVDALNVFPVPDGDTGTNMNLSMSSGAKEVGAKETENIGEVGQLLARGLLMGARGNSGVILSQLFRGFAKSIEGKTVVDSEEFASAFQDGVETAYKAVMKPIEGTILTVAKEAAENALNIAKTEKDVTLVMKAVLEEAKASLKRTPDLLPVLKEVGVVDSGGQGLVIIYEGFLASLEGKNLPNVTEVQPSMNELVNAEHHKSAQGHMNTEDIKFGYCTEFMVKFDDNKLASSPFSEEAFRNDLSEFGDSLLVVADDDLVKVHIHAEQPGEVLTYGQRYGSLINLKIENMREQHSTIIQKTEKPSLQKKQKEYGIVTVAMGQGVSALLESIGATVVLQGGQTMNPSTEDLVKAIEDTNAKKVIILPNNSNIVMTAEQAAEVVGKDVVVVPSKTVPQGMTALLSFNAERNLAQNKQEMTNALEHVKSGQVTYAVRNTTIDGIEVKKDDFIGISEGKIVTKAHSSLEALQLLLAKMIDEDDEILTVLYGADVNKEDIEKLEQHVEENFEDAELEIHEGKQPVYHYVVAVE
ncbi:DAK2 domain-containing protein [Priestia filamentosa]|uniref:DAK2 domain-containing protein n=1 Tax=Priestia filamentosa TaxID=1402861 RepID=UPI002894242B|nr:DAK2 domain-containing protein [Priestia filamentosa]MDT3764118.1 DAK2 domain-containing protein [Priestia filamentosa]WRU94511.1 DAK2 domain-containing protein [Priestia filamentosa]